MVREIKNAKSFEEIRFYPLEYTETPPPEIVVVKDADSDFRIGQISKYRNYLTTEINKREKIIKSFKNFDWVCFIAELLFVAVEICISIGGIIYPEFSTTTSSACVIITTVSTSMRGIFKKIMSKLEKHNAMLYLAKSKLAIVKDKYEIAMKDGQIDHQEFLKIVEEFGKYEALRQETYEKY